MKHVLLIEPDHVLAETYSRALTAQNYRVAVARGAQTGIFAADERRPDAVILEIQLVGHSGIEFLYELRSYPEWQDIPVIIHSQVPPAEFKDSAGILAEQLGVRAYLYKAQTSLARLARELNAVLSVPA